MDEAWIAEAEAEAEARHDAWKSGRTQAVDAKEALSAVRKELRQ